MKGDVILVYYVECVGVDESEAQSGWEKGKLM